MVGFILVSRGGPQHKNLDEIMRDLAHGSDRAVAIIGGSLVDVALTEALERHWHSEPELTERLFSPGGPLGVFSTKIDLGFLTGLYGRDAQRELHIIRGIRNDFAHKLTTVDFKNQSVMDRVKNLKFGERYIQDTSDNHVSERPNPKQAKQPFGQWEYWFAVKGRNEGINDTRGRFLLSVQALVYGLSDAMHSAMPTPKF